MNTEVVVTCAATTIVPSPRGGAGEGREWISPVPPGEQLTIPSHLGRVRGGGT
jgi:hypothetical protein